jgi:transposase
MLLPWLASMKPRSLRSLGTSESPEATLHNWLKKADIEDGTRPGVTAAEAAELRDAKKRIRLLEQENEILRRAAAFFARELPPK